jgi:glycogen debranching enzyme
VGCHCAHTNQYGTSISLGYNLINSPHLVPAFEVDEALIKFSEELESVYHLPCELKHQGDLDAVLDVLRTKVLPDLKLWQYYVIDAKAAVEECRRYMEAYNTSCSQAVKAACERLPEDLKSLSEHDRAQLFTKIAVKDDHPGKRFGKKVIPEVAVPFVLALCTSLTSVLSLEPSKGLPAYLIVQACSILTSILDAVNVPFYARYDDDMAAIVRNVGNTARYERLEEHGPKRGRISAKSPIMTSYFTRLPLNENTRKHPKGALVLANNGWIWGGNPLQDFAAHGSAYLRRDVIIWGDCVKLRYGTRYEDNPWLWEHMTRYVELMARYFHGFRLDNCHSTPIALAEHVLDAARRIRPNLYLTAELFTGDEEIDITYVSRLGIHSLVRESMRADDVRELSRLVHRYGGVPIGSFDERCRATPSLISYQKGPELPCLMIPVQSCIPHAIFMDCTHDNETPHQRRMAEDTLPNAAVVSMACCAIGSVRGYDELYPKLLDLVRENRRYRLLKDPLQCGIGESK